MTPSLDVWPRNVWQRENREWFSCGQDGEKEETLEDWQSTWPCAKPFGGWVGKRRRHLSHLHKQAEWAERRAYVTPTAQTFILPPSPVLPRNCKMGSNLCLILQSRPLPIDALAPSHWLGSGTKVCLLCLSFPLDAFRSLPKGSFAERITFQFFPGYIKQCGNRPVSSKSDTHFTIPGQSSYRKVVPGFGQPLPSSLEERSPVCNYHGKFYNTDSLLILVPISLCASIPIMGNGNTPTWVHKYLESQLLQP